MSEHRLWIRLLYPYPLDVNQLPLPVLQSTFRRAFGHEYNMTGSSWTIQAYLEYFTHAGELQQGLEQALIEYHELV